jgi:hypothetical protein
MDSGGQRCKVTAQVFESIQEEEAGLFSIHTQPNLAISEQAFLVRTSEGNILWDCISLLDEPTIERSEAGWDRGDRHFASALLHDDGGMEPGFDNAPIVLHQTDRNG